MQKSTTRLESPSASTPPVTPSSHNFSIPHSSAPISATFTVGRSLPNQRAYATSTRDSAFQMSTPPVPSYFAAPPSNCNTQCAPRTSLSTTSYLEAGIRNTTSLCYTCGGSCGSGSKRSTINCSACVASHGFPPLCHDTAYSYTSTKQARRRKLQFTSSTVSTSAASGSTTLISAAKVVYLRSLRRHQPVRLTSCVSLPTFSSVRDNLRDTKATGWSPCPWSYKHATNPKPSETDGYNNNTP